MEAMNLIDALGGPTRVAELLGIKDKPGAVQRVGNWRTRGIPARVLLDHPDVFARRTGAAVTTPATPHEAGDA